MANAKQTDDYTADRGYFDDRVGAGCLNVGSLITGKSLYYSVSISAGSSGGRAVSIRRLSFSEGDVVTFALAWNIFRASRNGTSYLTDYELIIEAPDGSTYSSRLGNSNVELVQFTAEESGVYEITVYQYSDMPSGNTVGDTLYIAYNY